MIITENHGPLIVSSTYWQSDLAAAGKLFVSVNAGAVRILVPPQQRELIEAARQSRYAVLSRGPWPDVGAAEAVEILFEDGSENPFALHLTPKSFDALPGEPEAGREWTVSLWTEKKGKAHRSVERICHWRRVARIPCLEPWQE
jgi:hypothetical protein